MLGVENTQWKENIDQEKECCVDTSIVPKKPRMNASVCTAVLGGVFVQAREGSTRRKRKYVEREFEDEIVVALLVLTIPKASVRC